MPQPRMKSSVDHRNKRLESFVTPEPPEPAPAREPEPENSA